MLYGTRTRQETPRSSFIKTRARAFSIIDQSLINIDSAHLKANGKRPLLDRLIIPENSQLKAIFDVWILLLVGYSCFTSVFYVAFDSPSNLGQQVFDFIVEGFFWLDFTLNFFCEYKDPETYANIRDLKLIAKRYVFRGSFFVDFISVFPFNTLFSTQSLLTKLFRLFRLPRLIRLIDISRFSQLLKSFFENSSRDERIVAEYMLMYAYRIFRLVIIALIITYFLGCFWFMVSNELNTAWDKANGNTFVDNFRLNEADNLRKLIVTCYFTLTTLATVGYGDYYPVSNLERIVAVFIMLCGVAFFSFIMGAFIEIISNYEKKMGVVDKATELRNWLSLLTRFTNHKPLPKSLTADIEDQFQYFWANDRLASLAAGDEHLQALPLSLKRQVMAQYLFEDVFGKFNRFFHTVDNKESRFLYDVAFGFLPRRFDTSEEDRVIYDEEDDVPEMYFVMEGTVGIGYSLMGTGITKRKQYKIAKKFMAECLICEHYCVNNQRAQFIYLALKEVKGFAITKKFL